MKYIKLLRKVPKSPALPATHLELITQNLMRVCNEYSLTSLAANLIGYNQRVMLINADTKDPTTLLNPYIIEAAPRELFVPFIEDDLVFNEDMSLSEKHSRYGIKTLRSPYIKIAADNIEYPLEFKADEEMDSLKSLAESDMMWVIVKDAGLRVAADVQRNYLYLEGERMVRTPAKKVKKSGRNGRTLVQRNGEFEYIKIKHLPKFEREGWSIVT